MISTVNFHLWEPCNMRCKFCFAGFKDVKKTILPKGHLPKKQAIALIKELHQCKFKKINFVGGEPTLCPWLPDLIHTAKSLGMITSMVTNGSGLTQSFLEKNKESLDWIGVSIDSINNETNLSTGRAIAGKKVLTMEDYIVIINKVKSYNYRVKINTVVNRLNWQEDLNEFMQTVQPERWKIFQVLKIQGQNDGEFNKFGISNKQFNQFYKRHESLNDKIFIVKEDNQLMTGSYMMVDPAGRFFDNVEGKHRYSRPILELGARIVIQQIQADFSRFIQRNGLYD